MQPRLASLLFLLIVAAAATPAHAVILYDGAAGTLPAAQGWVYLTNPLGGASAVQTLGGGAVNLDTTAVGGDQAGYFSQFPIFGSHPSMPTIDRLDGYNIRFDARLVSETHAGGDRAGLSVIALSAADGRGVEIGFWEDEIWTQNDAPLFTHGEGVAWNTTAALTQYDLTIIDDDYTLSAGGVPILSGPLRDYTGFGLPYTLTNFLFLGDDTSSARGSFDLALVEVTTGLVPEPSTLALAAVGIIALMVVHHLRVDTAVTL